MVNLTRVVKKALTLLHGKSVEQKKTINRVNNTLDLLEFGPSTLSDVVSNFLYYITLDNVIYCSIETRFSGLDEIQD